MNKKGMEDVQWILLFYVFLALFFFVFVFAKIDANKDDTAYYLKFYARDVAYGSEAMLSSDAGEISYVYPMKEGFDLKIDSFKGIVTVSKGNHNEEYGFRTYDGGKLEVEKYEEPFFVNAYLIKKGGSDIK